MKDWKTTVGGLLGAIGIILAASEEPTIKMTGIGLCAVASAWFGWSASDRKNH